MRAVDQPDESFWTECARIRPQLVRIASRHAAADQAEDIVHDALVRAAEFERLDVDRIRPFLVTVVKRLCVDDARRRATAARALGHPRLEPYRPGDPAEATCDQAEARWVAQRLAALMASSSGSGFSARERRLLAMLASGRSGQDLAAAHDATAAATQTAVWRVRGKLRALLAR